tara:strand:- start:359 stop:595 length:237 start_codon:yes stop_codon:yes gene_type:complete
MFNLGMSGEQLAVEKSIETPNNLDFQTKVENTKVRGRVDINKLMQKVRDEQKQQKKENLVFFGLVSSVVVITGLIASL